MVGMPLANRNRQISATARTEVHAAARKTQRITRSLVFSMEPLLMLPIGPRPIPQPDRFGIVFG